MDWNSLQVASPRESMHSELLMQLDRKEIDPEDRTSHPHFEIAAWLKLKNTEQLPSILLMEFTDKAGTHWTIVDTATIKASKGTLLLSGIVKPDVRHLMGVSLYLCHPNPMLVCEVEELRFNNRLIKNDYLSSFNVA